MNLMTQHAPSKRVTPEIKKAADFYDCESILNFVVNLTAFVNKVGIPESADCVK